MTIKVTDMNGKEFTTSLSELMDFTLTPGVPFSQLTDSAKAGFKVECFDSEGKETSMEDIEKYAKMIENNESGAPTALLVTFEASHSGIRINDCKYSGESFERDVASWKAPFAKPLLSNHDSYSEPKGRVYDAEYREQSRLIENASTMDLTFKVVDKDAMAKILDGRYSTMSIGGKANNVKCSICGKHIIKDGAYNKFCGHWKGESYDKETCYWDCTDIEYREGSIVNSPADKWAQIVRLQVLKNEDSQKDEEDNSGGVPVADSENNGDIDGILGNNNPDTTSEPQPEQKDGEGDNKDGKGTVSDEEVNKLKEAIASKDLELQGLKDSMELESANRLSLEGKVEDLENKLQEAVTKSNDDADKVLNLALRIKNAIVDNVVDLLTYREELDVKDKESKTKELKLKSTTELTNMLKDLRIPKAKPVNPIPPVDNPGVVTNNDPHVVKDDKEEKEYFTLHDIERKYREEK